MAKKAKQIPFGLHLMLDVYNCSLKILNDQNLVYNILDTLPDRIGMKKLIKPYVAYAKEVLKMKFWFRQSILTTVILALFFLLQLVIPKLQPVVYAAADVLILDSTVTDGVNSLEAKVSTDLGLTVEVVNDAGWAAKTTSDFSSYRAIVLGDPSCVGNPYSSLNSAETNKFVWGTAITGNVVIIGTDPVFHYVYDNTIEGAFTLIKNGIAFAVKEQGRTGLYITLSCYYFNYDSATPVPVLDALSPSGFEVVGQGSSCPDDSYIVARKHPVVNGLSDSLLSNWRCSTHEEFVKWPSDFEVIAISIDIPSDYVDSYGITGAPYILARGIPGSTPTVPIPFLDLPWDYTGKGLTFNEAALSINAYFDHEYPLLSSGLKEPSVVSDSIVNYQDSSRKSRPYSSHDGYDYGIPAKVNIGDSVLAAASGTATYVNSCSACGNMILVDHGNGYQTRYLHLQKDGLIINITSGNVKVDAGQQIGKIGATGNVSPPGDQGAHIHFGVFQDKNHDGNFDDNIPDGVTDPFGWQSKEADPWENYSFFYNEQNRTGNTSYYLWKKRIDNLNDTLTANAAVFNLGKYKVDFPEDMTDPDQELKLRLQSSPIVKTLGSLSSIGSTITITVSDLLGNIIDSLQKLFTLTIDFSSFDLTRYNTDTISIYSSSDGITWTKEPTVVDYDTKTASAALNHLTHFALMAERKDTVPPTTTAVLDGQKGQENWFRSDVTVALNAQDNENGLGVDYTLSKIESGDWETYKTPLTFTTEGHHKIEFYSADKDENIESIKFIEFDIDKTPPEAKIFIDQDKQDIAVEGLDNNTTTVEKQGNTETKKKDDAIYIIKDQAGNTSTLDVRDRDKEKKDSFKIYSMQYNQDQPINQPDNNYIVTYKGKKHKLNVDTQTFGIKKEIKIRIKYDNKKNQSIIITKEAGKEKVKEIKDGLILLQLSTEKGTIKYSY